MNEQTDLIYDNDQGEGVHRIDAGSRGTNSHPRLKMSVDSASTPENTSRQMYFIASFSSARHNYTVYCEYGIGLLVYSSTRISSLYNYISV